MQMQAPPAPAPNRWWHLKYWHYFPETVDAVTEITETFDFLWPTAAAIWNLRWQVNGLLGEVPDASDEVLRARFVDGSGLHGPNVRRFVTERTWEYQQQQLARVLLIELFAIYEGWCARVVLRVAGKEDSAQVKSLQFPTGPKKKRDGTVKLDKSGLPVIGGVGPAVAALTETKSQFLADNVVPRLRAAKKCAVKAGHLDNLLTVYRYFKEARNCWAHAGGDATSDAAEQYELAVALKPADLDVKEVPVMLPTVTGRPVALSLRGVVGLGDIVIRILTTLDADLAVASAAEHVLLQKWRDTNGLGIVFASGATRRSEQVASGFKAIRLPKPVSVEEAVKFLAAHRVAH